MNTKLCRVLDEIKRTEEKIVAWQRHLEELNIRKKQLEDAEIIKSIRAMKLGSWEMIEFLESIQNGEISVGQEQSDQTMDHDGNRQKETVNIGESERESAEREDEENEENN